MSFIGKYILNDWKLKGLSLILAIMLWFAVSFVGDSKMSISVPVAPANLEKDFMITKMDVKDVLVMISGPVSALKKVGPKDVKVILNVGELKNGRHIVSFQKTDIVVPKDMKLEAVKPDYVVIEIERILEKRLKTVVKLDKKWKDLYRVKSWYPKYVTVEGAKASIEKIDAIETVPIDGNLIAAEEELDVGLDLNGLVVQKLRPETIRVTLKRH